MQASDVLVMSRTVLGDLDDLCILLLFSVFEATFRERFRRDVAAGLPTFRHPALISAVRNLNEAISNGRFYRVLDPYKSLDIDLIEEVNQVRRYRNWVAHGRRGEQPNGVEPRVAYDRLRRFLALIEEHGLITNSEDESVPE